MGRTRMSAQSMATATDVREGDRRRWVILSLLVVAQFMVVLDVAIVNVALPTIKNDLHFSEDGLQWVITAYAIVFGGVLLLGGRMADLLGRRRIFMVGMAVFTIFSLLTGGLMLLGYALTHASQHGWATTETIGLLAASAALVVGFLVIELRSPAPLLPMRIFRLRTLTASNITALLLGASIFSQFFLLTLYMQQVLHYSALKTGVAYIALTLSIIGFSAVSQALVTRVGIRFVLPVGMALSAAGLVLYAQLPVHGTYFSNLFPAFILSGIGLAFAFVPISIGGLTGVRSDDAGVASGLLNTNQQIGGAIGVAIATTISTTYTSHPPHRHPGVGPLDAAALTHGFQIAFYVLAALAALAAVISAVMIEPGAAATTSSEESPGELVPALEEAA